MDNIYSKTNTMEKETPQESPKGKTQENAQSLKIFIGVTLIIAIVVGVMFYLGRNPALAPVTSTPIANTSVSPDTVRATVNGEEIIQATINNRLGEASQVLTSQGVDINDPNIRAQMETQIIEDTISYVLLKQGATKAGITVDPSALEEAFQGFVTQAGGEEQLSSQLQQAGLTEEEFKLRLTEQLTIDSYLNNNIDISEITITDKEITSAYDLAVANAGEGNPPPLADVRNQVEQQILGQKRQKLIATFTDTLRENAVIERK